MSKEEQDLNLQDKIKDHKIGQKPRFWSWVLHDKKAFKITYITGALGGLLVTIGLLALSLIYSFHIFFQVMFGLLTIAQIWNTYKIIKNYKYMDMTINELAYKGKYDNKNYEEQKQSYETSHGATG